MHGDVRIDDDDGHTEDGAGTANNVCGRSANGRGAATMAARPVNIPACPLTDRSS